MNTSVHSTRQQLLAEVHDFVSETGIAEGALGKRAVGDSRVVSRLRAGRGLTIDNLDRIRTFMAAERARRAADNGAEARSR